MTLRSGVAVALFAVLFVGVAAATATGKSAGPTGDLVPGVTVRVYAVDSDGLTLERIPMLAGDPTPNADRLLDSVALRSDEDFAGISAPLLTVASGWIELKRPLRASFRIVCDDGARLSVGGVVVVEDDSRHGERASESPVIDLPAGLTEIELRHFDAGGGRVLELLWRPEGAADYVPLAAEHLRTEADLTRVTAPGPKPMLFDTRPGDRRPLAAANPAWRIDTIRPEGFDPLVGAMAFDHGPGGAARLLVGTFTPLQRDDRSLPDIDSKEPDVIHALGGVTREENPTGDRSSISISVAADGVYEPAGMVVVDGTLYVAQRKEITAFRDLDGDGYYESRRAVARGWEGWNYHQFTMNLVHIPHPRPADGHPGYLYSALSTAMAPPAWEGMRDNAAPNGPMRGSIIEVDLSVPNPQQAVRVIAGGLRTPNGLGLGRDADGSPALYYVDNQGTWFPTNTLSRVMPGRFYGHYHNTSVVPQLADRFPQGGHAAAYGDRRSTRAAVYLPHNELCNSPTQIQPIERGPFAGQLLVGELTAGGLRRVQIERVDGVDQGAVFRHSQGYEVGINRLVPGPDGGWFVGGIGAGGNWNWQGTRTGLQRLSATGVEAYEIRSVHLTERGFRVEFTHPVDPDAAEDAARYTLEDWAYQPTVAYGGPKVDQRVLPVRAVRAVPGAGGAVRALEIETEGLRTDRCVYIRADIPGVDGRELWSPEAWYTVQRLVRPGVAPGTGVGVLPPADAVTLLGLSPRSHFRPDTEGGYWPSGDDAESQDGLIERLAPIGDTSGPRGVPVNAFAADGVPTDMRTFASFGDARVHLEFYCPPGGEGQLAANSGVYIQGLYEIQVLGTEAADAGGPARPAFDECGAVYRVARPAVNASTGPGTWQSYDIEFRAPRYTRDGGGWSKTEDARLTLYWNGRLVHDAVPIPVPTGSRRQGGEPGSASIVEIGRGEGGAATGMQVGRLLLQDHASAAEGPVRYRNIWVAAIGDEAGGPGEVQEAETNAAAGPGWRTLMLEPGTDVHATSGDGLWIVRGGQATFAVEQTDAGPVIVGTTAPNTPNTFLTTRDQFGDFELLYEARIHPELNAGVQIRSHLVGHPDGDPGERDALLRGYQVELDPSARGFSGGIYGERIGGWISPPLSQPWARRLLRQAEWNTFRVVASGPVIRTWVNGVPVAEVFDHRFRTGRIGLQVHGVGGRADPLTVEYRNVMVRPLRTGASHTPLYNGSGK